MAATASAEQIAKFSLRAGDTIITKDSETPDDIAVAAYFYCNRFFSAVPSPLQRELISSDKTLLFYMMS